jgi:hypothetical protein
LGFDSYRADTLPTNPRNAAVFTESPLDEIRKLPAETSEHLRRIELADGLEDPSRRARIANGCPVSATAGRCSRLYLGP